MGRAGKIAVGIVGVIIVAAVASGLYLTYRGGGGARYQTSAPTTGSYYSYNYSKPGGSQLVFSITDPPVVPSGTKALIISYSSLQADVASNGGALWVNGSGSGALDLLTLVNVSQVIGNATIATNATVYAIRFKVVGAIITIGNTTYNVTVPNPIITANVTAEANSTAQTALVDISPTILTVYTESNVTDFIMVPSVRGILVGSTAARVGARTELNGTIKAKLERIRPNITITSASLKVANNSTDFSVTVKNNGNRSAALQHILLQGDISVSASVAAYSRPRPALPQVAGIVLNTSTNLNASTNATLPSDGSGTEATPIFVSGRGHIPTALGYLLNLSSRTGLELTGGARLNLNGSVNSVLMRVLPLGLTAKAMRVLEFGIEPDGTLVLPFAAAAFTGIGYTLASGSSATFNYSAPVVFANGHIRLAPVAGDAYRIVVQGRGGARAETNVTAS